MGLFGLPAVGGDEAARLGHSGMPIEAIVGSVVIIPKSDAGTGIEVVVDFERSTLVSNVVLALGAIFTSAHREYSTGND